MTPCRRGEVVLIRFPNSDLKTYKKRPALVVQSDEIDTGQEQTIVALITSNLARKGPTRALIKKDSAAGQDMGLLKDFVVVTDNLATVLRREIDKSIGACPLMNRVDEALGLALGLRRLGHGQESA